MDADHKTFWYLAAAAAIVSAAHFNSYAQQTCTSTVLASTPTAQFIDHGNGTVTDTKTGLMWKRCSEGQVWTGNTCSGNALTFNWYEAVGFARTGRARAVNDAGGFAGKTDWRVPDMKELHSIVEERCYNPAFNAAVFPNVPAGFTWSSTGTTAAAQILTNADGTNFDNASGSWYLRLVRSGRSFGSFDARRPQTNLNGDSRSDMLWRNAADGRVYRMLMNGFAISNGAMAYQEANTAWKMVGDADFNGDGITDLLWRSSTTGQIWITFFDTNGLAGAGNAVATVNDPAWIIVGTPDLNGDGHADILWWNSISGMVWVMLIKDGAITSQGAIYQEPNTAWKIVRAANTNQVVWRNSSTGEIYYMLIKYLDGVFTQTGRVIYTEPNPAWKIIGMPDLNGDGASDLLWRNDSTGQVYGMLINGPAVAQQIFGSEIESQGMIYSEPNTAWKIVAQGDYNADGNADLLWRNESTGQVYMMLMNGLSISSASMVYTEPNNQWKLLGPYEYGQPQ